MIKTLPINLMFATLLLAGAAASLARESTSCSPERPEYGILTLHEPGRVKVYRRNEPLDLGTNSVICLGDRILASAHSGMVQPKRGETLILKSGSDLIVPRRLRTLMTILWDAVFRSELLNAGVALPAGALGSNDPRFLLAGVADGTVKVDVRRQRITIPIAPIKIAQRVELWAPGAPAPVVATVPPDRVRAEFSDIRPRAGERWQVVIDGKRRLIGSLVFEVIDWRGELNRRIDGSRLAQRDAVLAYACLNPVANGLEAYQLADADADRARIVSWQRPTDQLSCATPVDPEEQLSEHN